MGVYLTCETRWNTTHHDNHCFFCLTTAPPHRIESTGLGISMHLSGCVAQVPIRCGVAAMSSCRCLLLKALGTVGTQEFLLRLTDIDLLTVTYRHCKAGIRQQNS